MLLERGDIVFTRNDGIISRLIRWVTGRGEQEKSWASHVGLISSSGYYIPNGKPSLAPPMVIEALVRPGVVERPLSHRKYLAIARPISIHRDAVDMIVETARDYTSQPYTERVLLWHLLGLDKLLAGFFGDRWRICSWVVGRAYASVGLTFGQHYAALDPDEIFDFCSDNPDKYEWVIPPRPRPRSRQ